MPKIIKVGGEGRPMTSRLGSGAPSLRIKKRETHDADLQIKVLEEQTQRDVEAIYQEARGRAERERSEAQERGHLRGLGEGALEAARLLLRAKVEARRSDHTNAREARQLALFIAQKVVGPELRLPTEDVDRIIGAEVAEVRRRRWIRLSVSSADLDAFRHHMPGLLDHLQSTGDLEVRTDAGVRPGRCLVVAEGVEISLESSKLSELFYELYAREADVGTPLPEPHEEDLY